MLQKRPIFVKPTVVKGLIIFRRFCNDSLYYFQGLLKKRLATDNNDKNI